MSFRTRFGVTFASTATCKSFDPVSRRVSFSNTSKIIPRGLASNIQSMSTLLREYLNEVLGPMTFVLRKCVMTCVIEVAYLSNLEVDMRESALSPSHK